jgi:hypothetical protein
MEIVSNRHNNFSELCLVEANTYLEGCRVDLPPSPLTQPFVEPVRVIVLALDPNQIPTTLFAGNVGTTGVMKSAPATALSWFMTRGLYMVIAPVSVSMIATSTKDPWFAKSIFSKLAYLAKEWKLVSTLYRALNWEYELKCGFEVAYLIAAGHFIWCCKSFCR